MSNRMPNNNQQNRLSQLSQKYSMDTTATTSSAANISLTHNHINSHNNYVEPEYGSKQDFRSKELEETRARITQMEKVFNFFHF